MQDRRQSIGFLAIVLLVLGSFLPLVSLPIVGTLNYWSSLGSGGNGGMADGVFILGAAIFAAILLLTKKYQALILPAFGAAIVTTIDLAHVINVVDDTKARLADTLKGNPFAGLALGLANSIQIQWGWVVLYLGAILLAYVAIKSMGTAANSASQGPADDEADVVEAASKHSEPKDGEWWEPSEEEPKEKQADS
jgi:hypothetical protein